MQSYDGKWYEVMRSSDNVLEKGWSCVTETYTAVGDGNYDIHTPYVKLGEKDLWAPGQQMVCPGNEGHCIVDFNGSPDPLEESNDNIT